MSCHAGPVGGAWTGRDLNEGHWASGHSAEVAACAARKACAPGATPSQKVTTVSRISSHSMTRVVSHAAPAVLSALPPLQPLPAALAGLSHAEERVLAEVGLPPPSAAATPPPAAATAVAAGPCMGAGLLSSATWADE